MGGDGYMFLCISCQILTVFQGKPYPVVEFPDKKDPNSLYGKPCKQGFNSHYVTVKSQGGLAEYFPCNPEETAPDYDEIVIFNPDQILPRYLVYYTRNSDPEPTQKRQILWVDPNTEGNSKLKEQIEKNGVKVLNFSNSGELMAWLKCSAREADIRIISNRFRKGDGEESAGVRLCQWLQQEWQTVPFLLYCGNTALVKDLPQHAKLTQDARDVMKFALG